MYWNNKLYTGEIILCNTIIIVCLDVEKLNLHTSKHITYYTIQYLNIYSKVGILLQI